MNRVSLRFLAFPFCALLIVGCGSTPTKSYATQDLTGNWTFGPSDPPGPVPPFGAFTGALSGQGANVTAILRTVGCVSSTQDITFAGSESSAGVLTLISTNLPNNVATITENLSVMPVLGATYLGDLKVTGSGPCAYQDITLRAFNYPALTGNFAGTLTSNASYTATLTQQAANADGQFPETGTMTLTTPSCSSSYALTGLVTGSSFTASLSASNPSSTALTSATLTSETATVPLSISVDSGCSIGTFTGNLTP